MIIQNILCTQYRNIITHHLHKLFKFCGNVHPYAIEAEDEKELIRLFDEAMKQREVEEKEDADWNND